jgi:hypothetical protein
VRVSNSLGTTNSALAQLAVIQPELGIFNTGVDSAGAALPIGQADPHYVVIASPDPAYPGPTTFITVGAIPPWVSNDENSAWIAPRADDSAQTAPGSYRYRLIFTIESSDVATAAITGNVGTDDGNGGLFLNGSPIDGFPTGTGFGALTALVTQGFNAASGNASSIAEGSLPRRTRRPVRRRDADRPDAAAPR